ncbi:MAG: TonB-dependent receptor [Bacteroidota bacterium]
MRTFLLSCFVALLTTATAWGQGAQISGRVSTSDQGPLPGINIIEEGTSNGTITDLDGNFSFRATTDTPVLLVSYLGYESLRIPYTGQQNIDILIKPDQTTLDEVVVIGYGTANRKEITSSIATVEGEDLNRMTVGNVSESLQGLAAGVQVINNGGGPGAAPNILIRGIVTNQGTAPLIVVDGVPLPEGTNLNFLNPGDIEDLQILKDGSATSIYGTRASNGVILVTTKRGGEGKASISASVSYGIQNLQEPSLAGANEYARVINARQMNDGQPAVYDLDAIDTDTDWWNEVYSDFAPVQNYNLQINGGGDKLNYLGSIAYFRDESHLDRGYWNRVTARFNVDYQVSDRLLIQQDINPRYEHWENTPNLFFNTLRIDPLTPVFVDFDEREGRNEFSIYGRSQNFVPNPVAAVARQFNKSYLFNFFSNTKLTYDITRNISFSSRLGLTLGQQRNDQFFPQFTIEPGLEENPESSVRSRMDQSFGYVWNNLIDYNQKFGLHSISATAGLVFERFQNNYVLGIRNDVILPNENFQFLDAAVGEGIQAFGNEGANTLESQLFRLRYNYDNRYFLFGSFRRDGSSRFPVNNRFANFYSFSGAWNVTEESFFNVPFINNLKLKAGFGQVGNQNIPASAFLFLVGNENFILGENEDRVVTNFISQFGNPNLQWEVVEDVNYGVEASLFNNSLSVNVDYYNKKSIGLLFPTSLPLFTGAPSRIWQNVGSFESVGWDIGLGYTKQVNDWTFSANATVNINESRAVELAPGNSQLFAQQRAEFGNNFLKVTELGQVVGLFYGFETAGIFRNQTEVNSHSTDEGQLIQPNAQPGDLIFVDQNGDGRISEDDLTTIGNPFPDFSAGLNINITYKRFDLNMQWYGVFGNDVYNYTKFFRTSGSSNVNVQEGLIDDAWNPNNVDANIPRLSTIDPNGNFLRSSDYFVEDGTFVRLKNIQLGYNFDIPWASQFRLYVSGQNLLTFTDYTGLDPEVSAGGGIINGLGIDFGRYPLARTVLVGLNIGF